MIQIQQKIHSLAPVLDTSNPQLQASLPLPLVQLVQPIVLTGGIQEDRLMAQIKSWLANNNAIGDAISDGDNMTHKSITDDSIINWLNIGVDEVGRGPLYGSVVVAAALLPEALSAEAEQLCLQDTILAEVTDSKKLTEVKRERLFEPIKQQALAYLIVEVPAAVIDEINILQATMQAMRLACEQLMLAVVKVIKEQRAKQEFDTGKINQAPQMGFKLLIDGNKLPTFDQQGLATYGIGNINSDIPDWALEAEAWVKGDARHTAIAAASILAKVTRDRQMIADGHRYPGYGLEKHKGYPTKAHIQAIQTLGVLPEHRRSFKPVQEALTQTGLNDLS